MTVSDSEIIDYNDFGIFALITVRTVSNSYRYCDVTLVKFLFIAFEGVFRNTVPTCIIVKGYLKHSGIQRII